jgi:hypothetical protein
LRCGQTVKVASSEEAAMAMTTPPVCPVPGVWKKRQLLAMAAALCEAEGVDRAKVFLRVPDESPDIDLDLLDLAEEFNEGDITDVFSPYYNNEKVKGVDYQVFYAHTEKAQQFFDKAVASGFEGRVVNMSEGSVV